MAKVTRDNEVYTTDAPEETLEGTVEKFESGGWLATCSRGDETFHGDLKSEAVDLLDSHFMRDHTTAYG